MDYTKDFRRQRLKHMKKIIFITELRNPASAKASSTTIMINNLLYGLKQTGAYIHFIAFIDYIKEKNEIKEFYRGKLDKVTLIKSSFCTEGADRKYKTLWKEMLQWLSGKYRLLAQSIYVDDDSMIISHSPSTESVLLARELHKNHRYIQFWSDPMTISGIYPEKISLKRLPVYWSEKKALSYADEIVFGTKILYDFQKTIFPEYENKMRYVDICHSIPKGKCKSKRNEPLTFGYFGNYFSEIRNIRPLCEAFDNSQYQLLICGSGNVTVKQNTHIKIMDRISVAAADELEDTVDVLVCILNANCV